MKWLKKNYWLLIILGVFLFVSYFRLGRDWLYDWDEGIYGEIGRELKFPFLNLSWNNFPWFEKPFLAPFLVRISFLIFGINEFAARFFMPLFGVGTIYFVYKIGKKLFSSKIGLFAVTFFFFAPLFLSRSRMLNTDIALLFFSTASLFYFYKMAARINEGKKIKFRYYFLIAFLVSLAVLAKGIMGFLPLLIWGVYMIFFNRNLIFGKRNIDHWLIIGGLIILLVAPWHLYMTIRFGKSFWQVYFWEQVLQRARQPIEYHFGGRLYYIKFLLKELGWKLIAPALGGIILFWQSIKKRKFANSLAFLLSWGAVIFFLFTFAKTKLFWYILPLYPVLALFWGVFWGKIFKRKTLFSLGFFLILPMGLLSGLKNAGTIKGRGNNPRNELALEASQKCVAPLFLLVDENERRADDVLPPDLRLSSSFSYGGAPSVVFYYQGKVNFFYNVDEFSRVFLSSKKGECAMINKDDYLGLGLKNNILKTEGVWLLIKR